MSNSPPDRRKHSGIIRLPLRRRKRRAGERAGLNRVKIITAAGRLLEQTQAQGLNIRALAKTLGVVPTTIKSHFKGELAEIVTEIARAAIAGAARPYKPRETPAEYLGDVFFRVRKQLHGRPTIARLVTLEWSEDPILDPFLAERILLCVGELGAEARYLPHGLTRVIGRLSEMILVECGRSSDASQKSLARKITLRIDRLTADEFPMLTENAKALASQAHSPASGHLNPAVAEDYAAAAIGLLQTEIEQFRRRRGRTSDR
jgi:TetR/AcrR family transcriptional regulator, tetracycline repressor protein